MGNPPKKKTIKDLFLEYREKMKDPSESRIYIRFWNDVQAIIEEEESTLEQSTSSAG